VAAGGHHDLLHLRHLLGTAARRGATTTSIAASPSPAQAQTPGAGIFARLVVLGVALCFVWFGTLNTLDGGFKSLRMPSMTPLASLYVAIPLCGLLVALFTLEQIVNGWKNGFEDAA
jgi:hypothetical protein